MTRSDLRDLQRQKLQEGLTRIHATNSFYRDKWAQIDGPMDRSLDDLSLLPFTTKEELLLDQQAHPPYGSNLTEPLERYVRLHQTSGTSGRRLRWLDTAESWEWFHQCWGQIYDGIEVLPTDRFFLPFSFGPFLGFWAAFEGAIRRGCFTLAGGGMTSIARIQAIFDHSITVVGTTPTYARHLIEVAEAEGIDLASSSVRILLLAGEPGANIPSLRQRLETGWGARVIDHCGMTEVGSVGIEFLSLPGKLFLLENQCIAEFIDPRTGEPVPEGEIGELVLTNLGRWGSPLVRYRTGDIVRWRADVAPEGSPFVYLDGGILGRADDMVWIKGNNVYPSSLEAVLREHADVRDFVIDVDDRSQPASVWLVVERSPNARPAVELTRLLERSFQDRLYFRPDIRVVEPGSLPRFELKSQRIRRHSSAADST